MEHSMSDFQQNLDEAVLNLYSLVYARKCLYDKYWHCNLHTHAHAELFYVTKGVGIFQIALNSVAVSKGSFLIINANVPHTEISSKDSPLAYIVLGIKGLETLCGSDTNNEYVCLTDPKLSSALLPMLENIIDEFESEKTHSKLICDSLLKATLLYLLRQIRFSATAVRIGRHTSKECASIRRYIDAHHKENLTLDDLAAHAHISKYYLIHTFKREYGITPINYLQNRRIAESKKLLTETAMSVSQIAEALGFSSASHFTQCFSRIAFTTPTEFRKLNTETT